ncbi:hypothetical protein [Natronorubrum halophilum]|uniref:hypothetical protein n=1 Tax=Natronorubrum halophilum TaxID=1702106 RepID=UPI0013CF24E2|nr:hypothetical protein [Natronorubrum halophilum]
MQPEHLLEETVVTTEPSYTRTVLVGFLLVVMTPLVRIVAAADDYVRTGERNSGEVAV